MRARLILSEVAIGVRRNLTMTIALVITFAVSLALVGTALLVRAQVDQMKDYWYDKVQVSIFLCTTSSEQTGGCTSGAATVAQRTEIQTALTSLKPLVQAVFYETSAEAYARFQEQFAGQPIAANMSKTALPDSFRVKLSDPTQYEQIVSAFTGAPGVGQVVDQKALLDPIFSLLGVLQAVALGIAIIMIIVTVLLIANTMRVAAFSRRRETGIMRLVGASGFYIQVPFLLEAALGAAIGGILAGVAMLGIKHFFIDGYLSENIKSISFISWDPVLQIIPILMVLGVVLAAVTAMVTLRKYLRV